MILETKLRERIKKSEEQIRTERVTKVSTLMSAEEIDDLLIN